MDRLPDLSSLSHSEKDALIHTLWAQVQALTAHVGILTARVAGLEAKLRVPPKTPDNSSLPPSQGKKPNREDKPARPGPRQGSLGRKGGGRLLAEVPDETVTARPSRCARCEAALAEADLTLTNRFDKVDLPKVVPVVTRVERYAGHCRCCGRHRWVVERTLAWLARFRRLAARCERRADIHLAFTTLGCALVCLNQIRRFC